MTVQYTEKVEEFQRGPAGQERMNRQGRQRSRFDHKNAPLPSDVITALVYDKWGNLWIGTSGGVAVYNPLGTKF